MSVNDKNAQITAQMNKIYDADRDYEMIFSDLSEEDQKAYLDLRSQLGQ